MKANICLSLGVGVRLFVSLHVCCQIIRFLYDGLDRTIADVEGCSWPRRASDTVFILWFS